LATIVRKAPDPAKWTHNTAAFTTVKDESSFIHVHTSTGAAPSINPTLNRITLRIKRSINIGTTDDESQHPKER
jgi:hypothetical protein